MWRRKKWEKKEKKKCGTCVEDKKRGKKRKKMRRRGNGITIFSQYFHNKLSVSILNWIIQFV